VRIRYSALFASLVLVAAAAWSSELPAPPPDYSWRKVPAIKAAFLVPSGWHVREQQDGKTLAIFITEKAFAPPESFEVGLSVNVFLETPSAPVQLKRMLDQVSAAHGVQLSQGSLGPFATLSCKYDSNRDGGLEPVRIFQLGIANADTRTSYLVTFESPVSEWARAWKIGKPIVDALALETAL